MHRNTSLWIVIEIVHHLSFATAFLDQHGAVGIEAQVIQQVGVHDVDGAIYRDEYRVHQALLVGREVHLDVTLLFRHEVGTCPLTELCLDGLRVGVGVVQDAHVGITVHDVQHLVDGQRLVNLVGQYGVAVIRFGFLQVEVVEQRRHDGRATDLKLVDCFF